MKKTRYAIYKKVNDFGVTVKVSQNKSKEKAEKVLPGLDNRYFMRELKFVHGEWVEVS